MDERCVTVLMHTCKEVSFYGDRKHMRSARKSLEKEDKEDGKGKRRFEVATGET